jgi:hypothetical protein
MEFVIGMREEPVPNCLVQVLAAPVVRALGPPLPPQQDVLNVTPNEEPSPPPVWNSGDPSSIW